MDIQGMGRGRMHWIEMVQDGIMRYWTFGFHKMLGISWLAEKRLASQERLCSIQQVSKYMLAKDFSSVLSQTEIRATEIDGETMLKGRKKLHR
jgi:hypothetical protein